MKKEEDTLAERWKHARTAAMADPQYLNCEPCMGDLARWTGLPWFRTIGSHPVAYYLVRNFYELTILPGFGAKKCSRLVALVEASTAATFVRPTSMQMQSFPDPKVRLKEWGVDESYPVSVIPLSARALKFSDNVNAHTLGELLNTIGDYGESELLRQRNLGRKSVNQMLGLFNAIRVGDKDQARRWLPLAEGGRQGLSLRVAIHRLIADLDSRQRPLLERRFGQGMTLEESAQALGVTRERVRQIARDFLVIPLKRLLSVYANDREPLFRKWLGGSLPSTELGPFDSGSAALVNGALADIFSDTPEAIAAQLNQEVLLETSFEKLKKSREFHQTGVNFQFYLDQQLPVRLHAVFTEFLFQKPGLTLNHETGVITPEHPSLRRLVQCIIAEEEDPIPATWLLKLVQEAEAFKNLDSNDLKVRFRGWVQSNLNFPSNRILWDE